MIVIAEKDKSTNSKQWRIQAVSALPGNPPRAQKGWGQAHLEVVYRGSLEPDRFSRV